VNSRLVDGRQHGLIGQWSGKVKVNYVLVNVSAKPRHKRIRCEVCVSKTSLGLHDTSANTALPTQDILCESFNPGTSGGRSLVYIRVTFNPWKIDTVAQKREYPKVIKIVNRLK
jgi:hypothetical protein